MLPMRLALACVLAGVGVWSAGCKNESKAPDKGYRDSEVTPVEARKVLIDPKKYSGQVIKSTVRIQNLGTEAVTFLATGSEGMLNLEVPERLRDKMRRADEIYGKTRPIAIIYRFQQEAKVAENRPCNGQLLDVEGL